MATAVLSVPERSIEQRFAALEKANKIRTYRAGVKRDIAAGRKRVLPLLLTADPMLDTMKVYDLLLAQPKVGRVRANRLLRHADISPSKTVGGLTERQRGELALSLR